MEAQLDISADDIPRGDYKRYVRLYYTVATGPMTAGKITAGVTMGNQSNG